MLSRLIKYSLSGGAALTVHVLVLSGSVELLSLDGNAGSAFGFLGAMLVNYVLQYYWVFNSRESHRRTAVRYVAITGIMLAVNGWLFWMATVVFGWWYIVGQLFATSIVATTNFVANARMTFGARRTPTKLR